MHALQLPTTILAATLAITGIAGCSRSEREILPAGQMRERHQLTAHNAPTVPLDPSKVPSDLVDLVPLAQKWGIGDDKIREDFQAKASAADKEALVEALTGKNARITVWLDSQRHGATMSNEAAAFMYMQLGLDEMGLWVY